MDAFFFYLYAIVLALVSMATLIHFGCQRSIKRSAQDHFNPSGNWPKVTMIVPVTGASRNLVPCITSLLTQDYPSYETIFVTRSPDDPASPLIGQEIRNRPHARHIFGGLAVRCGQKNQNLLAGIKEAGNDTEILVFCDGTRLANSGWLKALVEPIVRNETVVATGYHQVIPQDRGIFSLAHAITVYLLFMAQSIRWFTQPWGGSTAISKKVFEELGVGLLWSRNVVDDVSLAARLREAGIKVQLVPDALLLTPLTNEDLSGVESMVHPAGALSQILSSCKLGRGRYPLRCSFGTDCFGRTSVPWSVMGMDISGHSSFIGPVSTPVMRVGNINAVLSSKSRPSVQLAGCLFYRWFHGWLVLFQNPFYSKITLAGDLLPCRPGWEGGGDHPLKFARASLLSIVLTLFHDLDHDGKA